MLRLPRLRRLSTRIIVSFVVLLSAVQGTVFVLVDAANRSNAQRKVAEELDVGERIFARLLTAQREQLLQAARVLASDFALREAVATRDVGTIESALANHGGRINAALAILAAPDGTVIAEVHPAAAPTTRDGAFPFPALLAQARSAGTASGVALFDGHAYQLVLVPVLAPLPVGWAALGFAIDDALVADLRELTALQVSVFAVGGGAAPRLLASSLDPALHAALTAAVAGAMRDGGSAALSLQLDGARFEGRAVRLGGGAGTRATTGATGSAGPQVVAVLQRSLDEVFAAFNRLQLFLVLLAAISLPLAAAASWVIARGITRPLHQLARSAARMQAGDYAQPVDPVASSDRGDEVALLAGNFNHMRSAIAEREREVLRLAYEDTLTGLPNRVRFLQALRERLAAPAEGDGAPPQLAVLTLDLDRFKAINDALGHAAGDEVLRQVGARLSSQLRAGDLVARLSGDEFGVLLGAADRTQAEAAAERLLAALRVPVLYEQQPLDVSAALGIACCPEHGSDAGALVRHADIALYAAKRSGGGHSVYDPRHAGASRIHLSLLGELRTAIAQDQLLLHFQPKLELASGRIKGAEALVRWQHPERGMVPPGEFMPWAEQTGFIRSVTRWVLDAALRQAGAWQASGYDLSVAINISARDLMDRELPQRVAALLHAHRVAPARVCLEITESSVMDDPAHGLAILGRLDALGVRLSIDDFGTGFSSLSYLKKLPVDELKIDRSFVLGMRDGQGERAGEAIVRSTIELAHNLGLQVVAEGIEDEPTLARLRELGCDQAQGYFISRPLAAAAFDAWLAARAGEAVAAAGR
jgi:diguanylate cyclase (GGDEF)-like protein